MAKNKFAVFDIDGTLFRSGLVREVIYKLMEMNVLDESIYAKIAAKEQDWRKRVHGRAFNEFEEALHVAFDANLPKLKVEDFEQASQAVIDQHLDNVYVYTRDLARDLKAAGYTLFAISGSHTEVVAPFAKYYGFDDWIGGHFERGDNYFTGEVIKTHGQKDKTLKKLIKKHGVMLEDSIGIGDTFGDIGMLEIVEKPIAFNPERRLFEEAEKRGWNIVLERKNMIYHLDAKEGYRLREARHYDQSHG